MWIESAGESKATHRGPDTRVDVSRSKRRGRLSFPLQRASLPVRRTAWAEKRTWEYRATGWGLKLTIDTEPTSGKD